MRLPTLAALLTVAAALLLVAPASAANVAPNPGFEDASCGSSPPCGWTANPNGWAYRDTRTRHSGQASLILELNPNVGPEVEARSVCITGLSAGPYDFSFWHFTSFWQGQELRWVVTFYSGACSGNPPGNTGPATLNSAWEQKSFVLTAPSGTQSATVAFVLYCIEGCAPLIYDANVDDVVLAPQQATAVGVNLFAARRSSGGVTLNWRTSSEVETLGFHVYRQRKGKLTRLNRTLITRVFGGTTTGHAYTWLDRSAPKGLGLRYRLQAVSVDGKRSWVGTTTIAG